MHKNKSICWCLFHESNIGCSFHSTWTPAQGALEILFYSQVILVMSCIRTRGITLTYPDIIIRTTLEMHIEQHNLCRLPIIRIDSTNADEWDMQCKRVHVGATCTPKRNRVEWSNCSIRRCMDKFVPKMAPLCCSHPTAAPSSHDALEQQQPKSAKGGEPWNEVARKIILVGVRTCVVLVLSGRFYPDDPSRAESFGANKE